MERIDTAMKHYSFSINGRYVEPQDSARLPVINPATGEKWATIIDARVEDVDEAVHASRLVEPLKPFMLMRRSCKI